MRKFVLVLVLICLVGFTSGCATWAGNRAIYAKSDNATIFGGWGYAHLGKGSAMLIWDNSVVAKAKKDFIGFLPVPQIQVDPNSNLNIGEPLGYAPSSVVAESVPPAAIEETAKIATEGIPLPK